MQHSKQIALTALALIAFAGNSVICRMALQHGAIDPASFTSIRLISGAIFLVILSLVLVSRNNRQSNTANEKIMPHGNWISAMALFVYAAGFSYAYISLDAGVGALILFGSVQVTMLSVNLFKGERFGSWQWSGFVAAFVGLIWLLKPESMGTQPTSLLSSALMISAGVAWGIYSLSGKSVSSPTLATAANFARACMLTVLLSASAWLADYWLPQTMTVSIFTPQFTQSGIFLAILSGVLTSGVGYALWYAVLPSLRASSAASLQLLVPVIATIGGLMLLNETITMKLALSSLLILGGVGLIIYTKSTHPTSKA